MKVKTYTFIDNVHFNNYPFLYQQCRPNVYIALKQSVQCVSSLSGLSKLVFYHIVEIALVIIIVECEMDSH